LSTVISPVQASDVKVPHYDTKTNLNNSPIEIKGILDPPRYRLDIVPFMNITNCKAFTISYWEINPLDGNHYRMYTSPGILSTPAIREIINPGVIGGSDTLCKGALIGKFTNVSPSGYNTNIISNGLDPAKFKLTGFIWWTNNSATGLENDYGTATVTSSISDTRNTRWTYQDNTIIPSINCTFELQSNTIEKTVMDCAVFSSNIVGTNNVVPNQTVTYSVVGQTGMRYLWTVTGGTILSGQGTKTISVLWDGSNLPLARVYGNSYSVSVTETNANNSSNTLSTTINYTTTGTTTALQSAGIELYPNPCQQQFTIHMPEPNVDVDYTIYSLRGEAVASGRFVSSSNNTLSNSLPAGMYQLVLNYKGQRLQTVLSVIE
jgi:hypothetical protein